MFQVSVSAGLMRLLGLGVIMLAVALPASAVGKAAAGKTKAAACAGCHGADGNGGADPTWPKLAGQHENYLLAQLQAFKSGARKDPTMSAMVASFSKKDMEDIAAYFSAGFQPSSPSRYQCASSQLGPTPISTTSGTAS